MIESEKVLNEWIARLEEAVMCETIHHNAEWREQVKISRAKLKELYEQQQRELHFFRIQQEIAIQVTDELLKLQDERMLEILTKPRTIEPITLSFLKKEGETR